MWCAISKPTILIIEDSQGRALAGRALANVFGGVVINTFKAVNELLFAKVLHKLKIKCGFSVSRNIVTKVRNQLDYEMNNHFLRCKSIRPVVDSNFNIMQNYS